MSEANEGWKQGHNAPAEPEGIWTPAARAAYARGENITTLTTLNDDGTFDRRHLSPKEAVAGGWTLPDTPEPTPPRVSVLDEAKSLITSDRNASYGEPTQNFKNTADLWNVQLGHKLKDGEQFTPADVAQLMVHLKMARMIAMPKRDNYADAIGYLACGWECEGSNG